MLPTERLSAAWLTQAALLEPFAPAAATAFRQAAEDLSKELIVWSTKPLDLDTAKQESGYHRDSLLRFIREGKVPNYGTETEPMIRRCDLPRKPGWGTEQAPALANSRRSGSSGSRQVVEKLLS